MKRLFRIIELTKNEQRVVLLVILVLGAISFTGYERRVRRSAGQLASAMKLKPSPTPVKTEDDQ